MFFAKKEDAPSANPVLLPLLPLRDIVVFPHMVVPLFVGRDRSIKALEMAMKSDKLIFLASQKNAQQTNPQEEDIFEIGTVGQIIQMLKLPDNTIKVFVEGRRRGSIRKFVENERFFRVEVEILADELPEKEIEVHALVRGLKGVFESYLTHNKKIPQEFVSSVRGMTDAARLTDTIAGQLTLKIEEKQNLLELPSLKARIERLLELMQSEIEIAEIEKKIRDRVKKQMEKSQKEYYLSEQMRAIQKEMGEKDDFKNEIAELEEQLAKKKLPPDADSKVRKEIRKLKMMSPMSAEATVVRNYIDWFLVLPWTTRSESELNIDEAQRILDEDHYGLKEVKERIIEYLAVQKLVSKTKGPILCLVGPPGVGKTSLARSVARSTGREFVRISLGGVRDEAEIRGHRRTYIGALPGKIIQSMKKVQTVNPVMLLDEVDKMSMDFRGDPSAALLEVLDPEQNHTFNDHYLDVDYDLSQVMFITTANTLHGIPAPLQDRMEIIRLAGYTELEKLRIAEKFLVPKQMESNGLSDKHIGFSRKAILRIVRRYTREAGVRNLERQISKVCRKVAREVVGGQTENLIVIEPNQLSKFLGIPKFRHGTREEQEKVGIATGLAWTEVGGELLIVEVATMPGSGKLTVTGKLGEVMQESAHAAMSYVRSRAWGLGLKSEFYNKVDIHIHVPEGATPKDGPSAGITMTSAIISALTKRPFPNDLAMTGEITLRGRVLPIGGLKEKLLAAKRGLIERVIIPKENEKDLREVPGRIRKGLKIVPVDHMDEVLHIVFPDMDQTVFTEEPMAAVHESVHLKQ
ncbi:MAG: endopeptidase La [Desulfomonile tiedjei]|uniref:Lon protease n=1 Tax=Desulfomonile tiedjei TaxID=2358 RepID=A0A9D6VAG1_9BACT|nr:endopeptidase La [Desulfomonile tiedjei]